MKFRASMRFTSCSKVAFDPLIYEALEDNRTWKRWERTMKGEITVTSGNILIPWEQASSRQKNLGLLLDQLLDGRPFLEVDQFDGLYQQLRPTDPSQPATEGILVMVVTPEPWGRPNQPSRKCSIDWLDSQEVESQQDIQVTVDGMLERLNYQDRIEEIRTFLFNTEQAGVTELAYEISIPDEFQPQLA